MGGATPKPQCWHQLAQFGLMMDCDTTGIEPDLALVKFKKLVGGGSMQIVNQTVPRALRNLGYQEEQVEAIVEHIAEHGNVVDAPGLRPEHYEVFDCAMGERSISAMGHVRMMAAVQPFISGAISKTVNLPETATVEEVEEVYFEGWKLGLKALAIYRNNCKVGQPLTDAREKKADVAVAVSGRIQAGSQAPAEASSVADRVVRGRGCRGLHDGRLLPGRRSRRGVPQARQAGLDAGRRHGRVLHRDLDRACSTACRSRRSSRSSSTCASTRPGLTDDPDVRMAQSIMDYIFRRLALDYLPFDTRAELGIFTADERAQTVALEVRRRHRARRSSTMTWSTSTRSRSRRRS